VENHTANMMKKLGIHDRVELARLAIREKLVDL
jgi:DNA-binding NarL/FixJ family response regulator